MRPLPVLRVIGIVLLLWAYAMNVHGVVGAWREAHQSPEAAAQEHRRMMQQHPEIDMSASGHTSGRPALSTAGLVLESVLLVVGALLALFPIRRGEWYG